VVEVLGVILPGAINKGGHPGAMLGGERLLWMRRPARPPSTLISIDEFAVNRPYARSVPWIGAGLRSKEEPPFPSTVTNYRYQLGCPAQCAP
jgi:hypothetical protein